MYVGLPRVNVIPHYQTVEVTNTATFFAKASGIGLHHFTYQWNHNGRVIKNKNDATLFIHSVTKANAGNYSCIVKSPYGDSHTSNTVVLSITSMYVYICVFYRHSYIIIYMMNVLLGKL